MLEWSELRKSKAALLPYSVATIAFRYTKNIGVDHNS